MALLIVNVINKMEGRRGRKKEDGFSKDCGWNRQRETDESRSSPSAAALWFSRTSPTEPGEQSSVARGSSHCLLTAMLTSLSKKLFERKAFEESPHLVALLFLGSNTWIHIINTLSGSRLGLPFADSIISVSCLQGQRGDTYPQTVVPSPNPSGRVE